MTLQFIWHRINWEMCCIGFDKQWPLYVAYYGVPYLWLGAYGLLRKLMLARFLNL